MIHGDDMQQREARKHVRILAAVLVCYDLVAIHISYFAALWVRFDCVYSAIPVEFFEPFRHFIVPYAILCVLVFWAMKLYSSVWRYASYMELVRTMLGSIGMSLVHVLLITVIYRRMPLSYYLWGLLLQCFLLLVLFVLELVLRQTDGRDRLLLQALRRVRGSFGSARKRGPRSK